MCFTPFSNCWIFNSRFIAKKQWKKMKFENKRIRDPPNSNRQNCLHVAKTCVVKVSNVDFRYSNGLKRLKWSRTEEISEAFRQGLDFASGFSTLLVAQWRLEIGGYLNFKPALSPKSADFHIFCIFAPLPIERWNPWDLSVKLWRELPLHCIH